jgi:hypothetical protein
MRFRITGAGWRLGDALCPEGTVLDFNKPDKWTRLAKGKVPFAAVPLDREALEAQLREFPDAKHLLSGAWS